MDSSPGGPDQTAGISLVIPVFNEAGHLWRFLEKVDRISLPLPCELVIVNDGSSDETREILSRFPFASRVQIVDLQPNNGKGAAVAAHMRARGYQRGDCIAVGDSAEDLEVAADVGHFFLMRNAIEQNPELALATERFANVTVTEERHGSGVYEAVVGTLAGGAG